ncbi:MAG: BlaI/MecI/CopY family transcriptional regulator [Vicinamibacterales bacterium]
MPSSPILSRREREILEALYALAREATAEDIRARLTHPPSYSAVRAMLAKLEAKGAIRHRVDGPRYVYEPTRPRTTASKAAVSQIVRVFFGGSPAATAAALLRNERWSDDELDALRAQIDAVRAGRRPS